MAKLPRLGSRYVLFVILVLLGMSLPVDSVQLARGQEPDKKQDDGKVEDATRTLWMRHHHNHLAGFYRGLYEKHGKVQKEDAKDNGLPEFTVLDGWLYIVGDSGSIGSTLVVAQAEGCSFVVQIPQLDTTRVIVRETKPGGAVSVYLRTSEKPYLTQVVAGQWIEFKKDAGGHVVYSKPQPFDSAINQLLVTIDRDRHDSDVP